MKIKVSLILLVLILVLPVITFAEGPRGDHGGKHIADIKYVSDIGNGKK